MHKPKFFFILYIYFSTKINVFLLNFCGDQGYSMFSSSSMLVLKRNCMEWSFRRDHKGIRMKAMWHDNDTSLLLGFTHRQWWHLHINETFLNERLNNIQNIQNRSVQKQVLPTKCLALTCFHIQRQIEYLTCPLLGVLSRTRILKILYYVPVKVNVKFSIWAEA